MIISFFQILGYYCTTYFVARTYGGRFTRPVTRRGICYSRQAAGPRYVINVPSKRGQNRDREEGQNAEKSEKPGRKEGRQNDAYNRVLVGCYAMDGRSAWNMCQSCAPYVDSMQQTKKTRKRKRKKDKGNEDY
jgi:hypothetical protein